MNELAESVMENTNEALTENGALSNDSTLNGVLEFFSKSGALRGNESEAISYFTKALSEDESLAMKALFYARDIRKGQGERKLFTDIIKYLSVFHRDEIKRNMYLIPEFGRWDDLFSLFYTPLESEALLIMKEQFEKDVVSDSPSLLAKWMKSSNTSSKESRKLAKITYENFGLSERSYRKKLSSIRKKIGIVEQKLSSRDFKGIDYEKVPSQASRIYTKAFLKNDPVRYENYISKVESGEKKINAGTIYPYQIVKYIEQRSNEEKKTYDLLWKALPDYSKESENSICVVDTSGSMYSSFNDVDNVILPIDVAISIGIYLSERIKGSFNGYFMTFSNTPKMVKLSGKNIYEKVTNLKKAEWGMSTNLQSVFEVLLKTAVEKEVDLSEMPSKIYIVSDMQFNIATSGHLKNNVTNFDAIKEQYKSCGYEMPKIVFWNVSAFSDTPVTKDENDTYLVSGCSPSILKYAMNCDSVTPYSFMEEVLRSDRYKEVK